MKASRYVVFGVAAVAAIALAFLVRGLIAGKGTNDAKASQTVVQAPVVPTVRVLIATHVIKAGTRIADSDIGWQDWPVNTLNPSFIVDPSSRNAPPPSGSEGTAQAKIKADAQAGLAAVTNAASAAKSAIIAGSKEAYIGGVAREDIQANEPIIDAKVVRADEGGFMAVMLNPGMRAMAVSVSVENTAGGFILPGDRVDIVATHQIQRPGGGGTIDSVQPVLQNIRVLAIDQNVNTDKDKQSVIGATATLEVTPADGEALSLAKASGSLSLMLRSYADTTGPSGVVDAHATGSETAAVHVYRNGQSTEVMVSR